MRRRKILQGLTAFSLAGSAPGNTQQKSLPRLSVIRNSTREGSQEILSAILDGLAELGFQQDRDMVLTPHLTDGRRDRLQEMARQIAASEPSVIVASGFDAAQTVKKATSTIPIVFAFAADPVQFGIVERINRPGGNATGVYFMDAELAAKRMEILRELLPKARIIGAIADASNPVHVVFVKGIEAAARALDVRLEVILLHDIKDVPEAFSELSRRGVDAAILHGSPLLTSQVGSTIKLAEKHRLPTMHNQKEHVLAGGLLSSSASILDAYRQVGRYAGRILKGDQPSDLPVMQPTHFQLAINLKTAKAFGIEVPPMLLARADEVIE